PAGSVIISLLIRPVYSIDARMWSVKLREAEPSKNKNNKQFLVILSGSKSSGVPRPRKYRPGNSRDVKLFLCASLNTFWGHVPTAPLRD
ncbi:hypothetical protein KUCAC02_003536, partial [Chaenocephalus aceratus]